MENLYIMNPRFKFVNNFILVDKLTLISYRLNEKTAQVLKLFAHEQRTNVNFCNVDKEELVIFFQLLKKSILLSINSSSPLFQAFEIIY